MRIATKDNVFDLFEKLITTTITEYCYLVVPAKARGNQLFLYKATC